MKLTLVYTQLKKKLIYYLYKDEELSQYSRSNISVFSKVVGDFLKREGELLQIEF